MALVYCNIPRVRNSDKPDWRVDASLIQSVNARELHGFLQSGKQFSNWIQDRITKYGFQEGVDYCTSSFKADSLKVMVRPTKEYHVSVGVAKELAMVERNEQGK